MLQLHDVNEINNNFIANNNFESEQTLQVSYTTTKDSINSDVIPTSNISNIMDSSLMSLVNNESICASLPISETEFNSVFDIDQHITYNMIDESGEKSLTENHSDNKTNHAENKILQIRINKQNLVERISGM